MKTPLYMTIKIVVDHPNDFKAEDIIDTISSECDYEVAYEDKDVEIIETEIMGVEEISDA